MKWPIFWGWVASCLFGFVLYYWATHNDRSTVACDECRKPITIVGPDLSENGHICDACAVRISLGVPLSDGSGSPP